MNDELERILAEYDGLPAATAKPCAQCPWRRASLAGFLGPQTAEEWVEIAHSDVPIPCHMTISHDGQSWDELRQCAGAATFRTNVCKVPRHPNVARSEEPDTEAIFASDREFLAHHHRRRV